MSDTIERIVLGEDVTFETVYSKMMGEGTWGGDMMAIIGESFGNEKDSLVPPGLVKTGLHEADEIRTYIAEYNKINYQNPTFEITKVNSVANHLEPVLVYR